MTVKVANATLNKTDLLYNIWLLLGNPIKRKEPPWSTFLDAREVLNTRGLPYMSIAKIGDVLHIDLNKEGPEIFRISAKTLQRRKQQHFLNFEESTKVFKMAEVFAMATTVLGDNETALEWLKEPNRALANKKPIMLLNDDIGRKLVEEVLGRIEHGVYS